MSVSHDREATATHESGHVVGELLAGRVPRYVRADWPAEDAFGSTAPDFGEEGITRENVGSHIIGIQLGPLAASDPDWPLPWQRLDVEATDRDVGHLAVLVKAFGLDEGDWVELSLKACEISRSEEFRRLTNLIAGALLKVDQLDSQQVRFLVGPTVCERYGIEPLEEVPE
jgi:hypothetical protein